MNAVLSLLAALFGSFGFCLIFHVRRERLLFASLGGILSWGSYLLASQFLTDSFLCILFAATCSAFYAEVLARVLKAPSTIFLIPTIIPLVPGSSLYYTMQAFVTKNWPLLQQNGNRTVQDALGIAAGMCIAWAFCDTSRKIKQFRRR